MTERILRPARDTSTVSSFSRESQDTEYVVDIPLSDFGGRTPEPDESEETGLIDSHHLRIAQEQDQQQQRQYFQIGSQYDDRESVRDGAFLSCNSETEVASFLPEEVKEEDDDESKDFVRRWYFNDIESGPSSTSQQLELLEEGQDPVVVNVSPHTETRHIEWQIPTDGIPQGSFELVLGVSSRGLCLNAVDCIIFDIVHGTNQNPSCHNEVIPNTSLHDLFATPDIDNSSGPRVLNGNDSSIACSVEATSILRWRLRECITIKSNDRETIRVTMAIETWKGVSSNPGAIGLHFLELHHDSQKVYGADPHYRKHNPFTWCVDVNAGVRSAIKGATKEIKSFCFSGDGNYVALLTHSAMCQHLELYHINQDRHDSPRIALRTLSTSKATIFDISVSWDGSQVVVLVLSYQRLSTVYTSHCHKDDLPNPSATAPRSSENQYSEKFLPSQLQKYRGKGRFYASKSLGDTPSNEFFVAFDGKTLSLFKVNGQWELFKTMTVNRYDERLGDPLLLYPYWKRHLRGGRLVLLDRIRGHVSTWDLLQNCPLAAMDIPTATSDDLYIVTSLSECGKYFAMATKRHIDVYLTDAWTRLGSWTLPVADNTSLKISSAYFMGMSGCIIVDTIADGDLAIRPHGYIVDIRTMTTTDRIHSRNLRPNSLITFDSADCSASMLLYQSPTELAAVRHTDRLVRPFSRLTTTCKNQCFDDIVSWSTPSSVFQVKVVHGIAEPRAEHNSKSLLSITSQDAAGVAVEVISIPMQEGHGLLDVNWTVVGAFIYLIVVTSSLVLVWRIPASFDGDYDLLLAERTSVNADYGVCQNQQLHQIDKITHKDSPRNLLDPHVRSPNDWEDITQLVQIFKDADSRCKRNIVRYVELHIHHCLDTKDEDTTILTYLCNSWTPEFHENLLPFIRALFGSPTFRWVPTATMRRKTNPISILLEHLRFGQMVVDIAEIMVRYCVRQAIADSDLRFFRPIFLALRAAIQCKNIDSDQLSRTTRAFAYFPACNYHFAMDHHAFASSMYQFHEWHLELHERKHPVLYLTSENSGNRSSEKLTPHLFVASFDMLWAIEEIPALSWKPLTIAQTCLLWITFTSKRRYVCHPYNVKDLDNPALAALVRFKWRQFGFLFWFYKVFFYGFVAAIYIISIFIPKSITESKATVTVLITGGSISFILALGSARDLLVLACLGMRPRDYKYKITEITGALLPAVAVLATKYLGTWNLFDFLAGLSFLFVLLQLFFEFRVMKTIGRFLSVFWQAIRSASLLFAVYTYMLGAFGVVFLYLKYFPCKNEDDCKQQDEVHPFVLAMTTFTSTYFMTGGMYDLVEKQISSNDWKFHLLMASFLFMVTIMLNILIGIITHAFGNSDRTSELEWMEARMLFVVRAENTFRSLPYFRDITSWFPETIYYTATFREVRDYRLESQRLAKEAAAAALLPPLEANLKSNGTVVMSKPITNAVTTEQQTLQQQQQQPWVDRLKEDMMAEFKKQLEAQKKQSNEQMQQLQVQLSDQMQAQLKEIMAALRTESRED